MRGTTRTVAVAGISAAALLLASCSGGGGEEETPDAAGKTGGSITSIGCDPENPLVPNNTGESCGNDIMKLMVAGLVHYDPSTAKPDLDIAESIESTDNQTFTVKLKKGYKFHDGTEVLAKNFVDAWNFTNYAPNAFTHNGFGAFSYIEGYDAMQSVDPDEEGPKPAPTPAADKFSGLKVIDDHTFEIKTTTPFAALKSNLGYSAFAPLPDSFFADPKTFGDKPVGAGPYKLISYTKGAGYELEKFADYSGKFKGNPDKISLKVFESDDASYNALLAGQIDVTHHIPPSALAGDKWKSDLANRTFTRPTGANQTISFPPAKNNPALVNPKVRKAISMAIDRKTITDKIFNGARIPATSFAAPAVDGFKKDNCGEACTYDPAKAKALLAEGGGFTGKLTITSNGDAAHKDWIEAVCNNIKQNLGIECTFAPVVDFATFLGLRNDKKITGMFRSGWGMDYPSIQNFLEPIYGTNQGSNDTGYSNPAFDAKLKEAAAATDAAKSNELYQEAERMLAVDLPAIPLWDSTGQIGWSEKVAKAEIDAFGDPNFAGVTLK